MNGWHFVFKLIISKSYESWRNLEAPLHAPLTDEERTPERSTQQQRKEWSTCSSIFRFYSWFHPWKNEPRNTPIIWKTCKRKQSSTKN